MNTEQPLSEYEIQIIDAQVFRSTYRLHQTRPEISRYTDEQLTKLLARLKRAFKGNDEALDYLSDLKLGHGKK
jgi:hypothetical protein